MTWTLSYGSRFRKTLQRLPGNIVERVQSAVDDLRNDPLRGKPLKGYVNVWTWDLTTPGGEYRIIYRVYLETETCLLILVECREEVYKTLRRLKLR